MFTALVDEQGVTQLLLTDEGAFVPLSPQNPDYVRYLRFVSAGGSVPKQPLIAHPPQSKEHHE